MNNTRHVLEVKTEQTITRRGWEQTVVTNNIKTNQDDERMAREQNVHSEEETVQSPEAASHNPKAVKTSSCAFLQFSPRSLSVFLRASCGFALCGIHYGQRAMEFIF